MHYGMDVELKTVEHEMVDVEAAVRALRDIHAHQKESYEAGEEAIAATSCGFSRAEDDFIELCVNGKDQVSVSVELPMRTGWWIFKSPFAEYRPSETLVSAEDWIRKYFALPHPELAEALQGKGAG